MVVDAAVQRVCPDEVEILDAEGAPRFVDADTVVIAVGQQSEQLVPVMAVRSGRWHRVIGGARDAAGLDAVRAIAEAHRAAAAFSEYAVRG